MIFILTELQNYKHLNVSINAWNIQFFPQSEQDFQENYT